MCIHIYIRTYVRITQLRNAATDFRVIAAVSLRTSIITIELERIALVVFTGSVPLFSGLRLVVRAADVLLHCWGPVLKPETLRVQSTERWSIYGFCIRTRIYALGHIFHI